MHKRQRYQALIEHFSQRPTPTTELKYTSPFHLVIAVILSAQCTDKRVNQVTPPLLAAFPTPTHLAASRFEDVFPYIQSVSYPNNKTRHLISMSQTLVDQFGGQIPEAIPDLQKLAGVGRKSAHVLASVLYDTPAMAVDTHVMRVSKRLGLVDAQAKTPLAIEKQLVQHIPKTYLSQAHHWLILHGRYVCLARKPKCASCEIHFFCKYYAQQSSTR